MGLLAENDLPAALVKALEMAVGRIPTAEITQAARTMPEFATGGFRVSGAKPETLRRRAVQLMRSKGPVPERLKRLIAVHSLQGSVVSLLSEDVLQRRWEELSATFGAAALTLGMLLDPRSAVREVAAAKVPSLSAEEVVVALPVQRSALERVFGGLLGSLAPVLEQMAEQELECTDGDAALGPRRVDAERLKHLEKELAEVRERAGRVARLESKIEKLESTCESLRRELADWKKLAEERGKESEAAQERGTQWRDELERLQRSCEERVRKGVDERLAEEAFAWLREVRSAEEAASETATPELEKRVRQLLERQCAVDRKSGTLQGLRQRHADLVALRDELRTARAEALNPLGELAGAERELDAALARLERTPGVRPEHGPSPLVQTLVAHLADAGDKDDARLAELLRNLEHFSLLGDDERTAIAAARKRRLSLRLAREQPRPAAKGADPQALCGRLWRQITGSTSPRLVLVDGHNVLLGSGSRYASSLEADGRPGERAREALAHDADAVALALPGTEVRLYFDGPVASESAHSRRVMVVYSGGRGADRADNRMVEYLRFRSSAKGGLKPALVTDDSGLIERGRAALRTLTRLACAQWEDLAVAATPRDFSRSSQTVV